MEPCPCECQLEDLGGGCDPGRVPCVGVLDDLVQGGEGLGGDVCDAAGEDLSGFAASSGEFGLILGVLPPVVNCGPIDAQDLADAGLILADELQVDGPVLVGSQSAALGGLLWHGT